jgi:hypothetical protein
MSLHPTLSEDCAQASVKKYFYDGLKGVAGVPLYFSYVFTLPSNSLDGIAHDTWIRFHFDGMSVNGNTAFMKVNAYLFSRGSETKSQGRLMAQTRDKLFEYLVNTDEDGNGIKAIPLLDIADLSGPRLSSMIVAAGVEGKEGVADDKTIYRHVPIILTWVTV